MAHPRNMLLLAALLALASAAHGAAKNVTEARIAGQFVCSVTGTPLPGVDTPGLPNEKVKFVCNGTQIAETTTNATGHYYLAFDRTNLPLFEPSICFSRVDLPVNNCTLFPTDGFVQAAVSLVDVVANTVGAIELFVAELLGFCVAGNCTYI